MLVNKAESNFQYLLRRFPADPLGPEVEKIRGPYVYTKEHGKLLDFTAGYSACVAIGGSNRKVQASIKQQLKKYSFVSALAFSNSKSAELAELLVRNAPRGLNRVMFPGCSGSEAIEAAMRMSYQVRCEEGDSNRSMFITRSNAYHGITAMALSLTTTPVYDFLRPIQASNVVFIPQHNFFEKSNPGESESEYAIRSAQEFENALLRVGPEKVSGFVAETMLGQLQGNVPPSENYWKLVREICDRYGVHLILDEVYCGLGRSGKVYCCEWDEITPDFVAQGKQLAAGYGPISAVVTKSSFEEIIKSGQKRIFFASTYEAHPLAVAAAIEVQKIVQSQELLQHVNAVSSSIKSQILNGLGEHCFFKNVRGRGMLMSLEYDCKNRDSFNFELEKTMLEKHHVILSSKYHRTNFTPPSTTSKKQVENVVARFIETFIKVSKKFSN
jgi:adenosylmethionine-8-amino-7-oxononanoate aminotransferase